MLRCVARTARSLGQAPVAKRNAGASCLVQQKTTVRHLNIHEYQGQHLMRKYGIKVPAGGPATSAQEAERVAELLDSPDLVIKAQILAGGRGKGTFTSGLKGGVHVCHRPDEVRVRAEQMLGQTLVTKQTGAQGRLVSTVLISQRLWNRTETYFAILMDRKSGGPLIVASSKGGMDIEKVAEEEPQSIMRLAVNIHKGPSTSDLTTLAVAMGFSKAAVPKAVEQMTKLYDMFLDTDANMIEINPFVETSSSDVVALDAKVNFDPNAEFRHPELFKLRDESQNDQREVAAEKHHLNYIGLDGDIGCLVNGAGLAMATMDIIKLSGGSPANFLDIGGGASQHQVMEAIKILNDDPNVKAILVNIFGGIMRCDVIALGIVNAVATVGIRVPLVVRLQGTNVEQAKKILEESGLPLMAADDLEQAAQRAVRVVQIIQLARQVDLNVSFDLPL